MGDFRDPVTERVLPMSRIHVQLNEHVRGWRWVPDAALQRIRASGRELTAWAPLTGDPASFARISIPRMPARWCVLVGELPSPESRVVVTTEDGNQVPVDTIEGRLWACEWSGPPLSATVSVDGDAEVSVSFFRRRIHYAAGQPEDPHASPGRVLTGWYRYKKPDQ